MHSIILNGVMGMSLNIGHARTMSRFKLIQTKHSLLPPSLAGNTVAQSLVTDCTLQKGTHQVPSKKRKKGKGW